MIVESHATMGEAALGVSRQLCASHSRDNDDVVVETEKRNPYRQSVADSVEKSFSFRR